VSVRESQHNAVVADDRRRLIQPWQDRFRDPALTVLLALEICTICLAVPLAAKGLPTAQVVADTLVLAMIAIVVDAVAQITRDHLDLAGPGGHRRELPNQRGSVAELRTYAPPRRRYLELRPDLGTRPA
jgi:hypothetical protein